MKAFLKRLDKISLFVAAICTWSLVDSVRAGSWVWVAILGLCVFLNLRIALPQEYRWPKRFF